MTKRAEQVGRNEEIFRQVNEQVHGLNDAFGALAGTMTMVCECGDAECIEQIHLDAETYARVRADAALFVVRTGHGAPDVELVVEDGADYQVVRKRPGDPEQVARELDSRV